MGAVERRAEAGRGEQGGSQKRGSRAGAQDRVLAGAGGPPGGHSTYPAGQTASAFLERPGLANMFLPHSLGVGVTPVLSLLRPWGFERWQEPAADHLPGAARDRWCVLLPPSGFG